MNRFTPKIRGIQLDQQASLVTPTNVTNFYEIVSLLKSVDGVFISKRSNPRK